MVFRRLREIFKIDKTVYIHSIGPEQLISNLLLGSLASLSELVSEGKSGALFYYTANGKFIIKTVSREAALALRGLLPDYFAHFSRNSESLIARFLGLHAIHHSAPHRHKWRGAARASYSIALPARLANIVKRKIYFLVMENLFHTPVPIHRRYDLKGSTYKRSLAPEFRQDTTIALKDNDLEREGEKIDVGPECASKLLSVLRADAEFLKAHGLMDYSLLVGIYYAPRDSGQCGIGGDGTEQCLPWRPLSSPVLETLGRRHWEGTQSEPFWRRDMGGIASSDGQKLFYLGIIDILTQWGAYKRAENAARVIQSLRAIPREAHRLAGKRGGGCVSDGGCLPPSSSEETDRLQRALPQGSSPLFKCLRFSDSFLLKRGSQCTRRQQVVSLASPPSFQEHG
ncbi:hypothetical protein Efla_001251 [Eimeria flavescens]